MSWYESSDPLPLVFYHAHGAMIRSSSVLVEEVA
jgi:hypothetical protein